MDDYTLTQERQQLRSLLEQYSDTSKELPNLKVEASEGWAQQLQEWLQEFVATSWEWLKALMGPLPTANVQTDWTVVLQILFWTCVAVLVFWLTFALSKKFLVHKGTQGTKAGLPMRLENAEELLQNKLIAAVKDENWGLAARLRWRLFLYRMRCQPNLTPNEFFGEPQYRRRWDHIDGTPVSEQYGVMFAAIDGSHQWFETYHGGLSGLEGDPSHG